MKNAISPGSGIALSSSEKNTRNPRQVASNIPNQSRPAQALHQQLTADNALHVGAIWKSPRDKRQCIQGTIKSYNGSPPYFDLRLFELDAHGRMQPTHKGVTVSMSRLPQLAQLLGAAVRKAHAAGLITAVSS